MKADLASEPEEDYDSDFDIEACSEIGDDDCWEGNDLLLFLKITMFMNSKSSYLSLIFWRVGHTWRGSGYSKCMRTNKVQCKYKRFASYAYLSHTIYYVVGLSAASRT